MATKSPIPEPVLTIDKNRRQRVSQTDIPRVSLDQALRVPYALANNYAKKPARPLDIATALEMSPTSGPFRVLCGAAIGYGLTDGGPNAQMVSLTSLGERIVAPLEEGDDVLALRAAVLVPAVQRQFLEKYDGSPIPEDRIGRNVLESMGVPADATQRVFALILENAERVGFLKKIKEKKYVDLGSPPKVAKSFSDEGSANDPKRNLQFEETQTVPLRDTAPPSLEIANSNPIRAIGRNRKVFVSHGKSKRVVEQLKDLLQFGDFEPVVSVDRESVSKPVPQKVLDDMRICGAGIIHVKPEEKLLDAEGKERRSLNQNVLIEIGAAMALYGEHFILLVEDGTTLPSNLQGLYEVRYSGDELGYEATMKVLKALNQFKAGDWSSAEF